MALSSRPTAASAVPLDAVRRLYVQLAHYVRRSAVGLGVSACDLDDCVQDVFLAVHRRLGSFEGRSSMRTWIFGVTRLVVQNYRRRARRRPPALQLYEERCPACAALSDEQVSTAEQLDGVLGGLPREHRLLVMLSWGFGFSAPEIAEMTHTNVNTTYTRLRRARRDVRLAGDDVR